jgi:hypothetical protein
MKKLILVAVVLVVGPAAAQPPKKPPQPRFVDDVSDSSGNYFNGLRAPNRPTPSNWKPYCYGNFQQCSLDSAANHQDVNVR